jgi:signal transduction histidine kinase
MERCFTKTFLLILTTALIQPNTMHGIFLRIKWFKQYGYLLLLLLIDPCFAQTPKLDSVQAKLKQNMPDTVRIKLLKQLSSAAFPTSPQQKFYYADMLKQLAEKTHNEPAAADAYINMGSSYVMRTKYDSALYYFSIGYEKAKKINFAMGMGRSLVNMGLTYDRMDDSRESIRHYILALDIFKKNKIQKGIDQCNNNIGSLYYDLGQFKTAESYFKPCLESYTKNKDSTGMASAMYSVGSCEQALGNDHVALGYFNNAMAIYQKLQNTNGIALVNRGLGLVYMHLKQYDRSVKHLNEGLKIVKEIGDKYEEAAILKVLVEVHVAIKDYTKAEAYARQFLAIGYMLKAKSVVVLALRGLVSVYESKKDITKAFEYQSRFVATEDSILNEKELHDVTLAEFSRVRNENANLNKDNQSISLKNTDYKERLNHYSNVIVTTSVILVSVILLLLMLYHRNLEKQATNKLLTRQKEEIANINHELETLNEEVTSQMELTNMQNAELERLNDIKNKFFSIVSHDLRGPLVTLQSLFSIYREGNIQEEELRMLLSRLEETILNTGTFLDNLLEWSKSQMEGIVINPVNFNISECITENIHLLETKIEQKNLKVSNLAAGDIQVYADQNMINLVIRNLLSNSVKFCNPGDKITMNAQTKENAALISIHDTGPGISEADREKLFSLEHIISTGTQGEKGNHLGLILCRDMVVQNNGNIWLDLKPGEGTTFWIELPLSI